MKVLLVTGIFPPDHGGPSSYVASIAKDLSTYNIIVTSIISLSDVETSLVDNEYNIPIVRIIRGQNKLLRILKTIFLIYKYSKNADLVYVNGLLFESTMALKVLRRSLMVVKIVGDLAWEKSVAKNLDGLNIEEFQKKYVDFRTFLEKKIQSFCVRQADAVITPSQYLKKIILSWGVIGKNIRVIYNAVRNEKYDINFKNRPNFDLVTVSRLIPLKRIDEVIRLCSRNNYSLLVIGDGPELRNLKSLAADLNAQVVFLGHVEKNEIINTMRAGKVFVLNSIHEGLPHVILEAKKAGVPVVATNVGGVPELITHREDGLLVDRDNHHSLESALSELFRDSVLYARILSNSQTENHKFTWLFMLSETTKVFKEVCFLEEKLSI